MMRSRLNTADGLVLVRACLRLPGRPDGGDTLTGFRFVLVRL